MSLVDLGTAVDLRHLAPVKQPRRVCAETHGAAHVGIAIAPFDRIASRPLGEQAHHRIVTRAEFGRTRVLQADEITSGFDHGPLHAEADAERSEEHTSELQSLMRISYAVFCLKKNTLSQMTN